MCKSCGIFVVIVMLSIAAGRSESAVPDRPTIRVATYNTSLFRDKDGQLIRDLEDGGNEQARKIAEVVQRVRPDVLLVNEFDYDEAGRAADLFQIKYLAVTQNGCEPIRFKYSFIGPVNTGVQSGRDLGHNGKVGDPDDAFGFGRHPGQYGMLVLSKFPIDRERVRSFQKFLWRNMPGVLLPTDPKSGKPFYNDEDLAVMRLSSKSHWDIPIAAYVRNGSVTGQQQFSFHLICSHPTPPVFDGPEDRNGRRNHDEIRLIADFIDSEKSGYLIDDAGKHGGLPKPLEIRSGPGSGHYEEAFVILGDLNCDPVDGEGMRDTMDQLLKNPLVNASSTPTSEGGPLVVKAHPEQIDKNHGDPSHVTADFTPEKHGSLRIDYVLPSRGIEVVKGGIFWPKPGEPGADAINATDHHSVWLDIRPKKSSRD